MLGCDDDWKKKDDEDPYKILFLLPCNAIDDKDDDSEEEEEDEETFDFTSIDSIDVLSDETLKELRCPKSDKYVKCRKCFALAISFLSVDLSCKLAELSREVHVRWKKAVQLVDSSDEINITFKLQAKRRIGLQERSTTLCQ
jgi:hypothetical protein